jgi:hypothetical protein
MSARRAPNPGALTAAAAAALLSCCPAALLPPLHPVHSWTP